MPKPRSRFAIAWWSALFRENLVSEYTTTAWMLPFFDRQYASSSVNAFRSAVFALSPASTNTRSTM
ncbi:MAG TPA: hypothetical protein VM364_07845 [Vicinamibacterales bacterium]|nr:hypothetical protein [Vicinamibacterales bacterium]